MDGRFKKVDVKEFSFEGGGGIHCNNPHKKIVFDIMRSKFGSPNGNSLRHDFSTWKYVLAYQSAFLTVYDYGTLWSLGFVEVVGSISDYEITKTFSAMLFRYLQSKIELATESAKV